MNETIAKTRPKTMTKLPFSPCIWPFLGSSAFQVPSWLSFLSAVHLEVVFRPLCCFAWYTFFGSRRKKCITCPLRSWGGSGGGFPSRRSYFAYALKFFTAVGSCGSRRDSRYKLLSICNLWLRLPGGSGFQGIGDRGRWRPG